MYIVPSMMCKMYVVLDFNNNHHPAPCLDVTGLAPINNPVVDDSDLDTPSNARTNLETICGSVKTTTSGPA